MTIPASQPSPPVDPGPSAGLALFLRLEQRLFTAGGLPVLQHRLVNEIALLTPCRQALVFDAGRDRLEAASGVVAVDRQAPFGRFALACCRWLAASSSTGPAAPRGVQATDLPPALARDWPAHLPAFGCWLPLFLSREGEAAAGKILLGGVLLARETPFSDREMETLGLLRTGASMAWAALSNPPRRRVASGRWPLWALLAAGLGWAAMTTAPVTVVGQAEVAPRDPFVVRAPMDGVIREVLVEPGQLVAAGQQLVRFRTDDLQDRLELARHARAVTKAEHDRLSQAAFADPASKGALAVAKAKIDESDAEIRHAESMVRLATLVSPVAGVALFRDRAFLEGVPARLGERLLTVADPARVQVVAWVPAADAIPLPEGGRARLFLNTAPDHPLEAVIRHMAVEPEVNDAGVLAYLVEADFTASASPPPRLGLRGVARLHGQDMPLWRVVFRKPLAWLRQWLAW